MNATTLHFLALVAVATFAISWAAPTSDDNQTPVSNNNPDDDDQNTFTGHCTHLCARVKKTHKKGSKKAAVVSSYSSPSIPIHPVIDQIVGKYTSVNKCMVDCQCASYCNIFEQLLDLSVEDCVPACRKADPLKTKGEFFPKLKKLLLLGLD